MYVKTDQDNDPYEPVLRGCRNIQCFCPGTCREVIAYKEKKTGKTISVEEYRKISSKG